MKEGIEIEIHYRYSDLDKRHEYSVVCRERDYKGYSANSWIFWIWYRMGESLMQGMSKNEMKKISLLPHANTWDEKSKLIKGYKDCNSGHRIVPAILKHFNKVKNKKIQPA